MKGHYLLLVLPDGKHSIRREYVPLVREDETVAEATERWIENHPDMIDRQRNRARVADRLRGEIIEARLCRPSSWHRAQAEAAGLPWPAPPGKTTRRRGR